MFGRSDDSIGELSTEHEQAFADDDAWSVKVAAVLGVFLYFRLSRGELISFSVQRAMTTFASITIEVGLLFTGEAINRSFSSFSQIVFLVLLGIKAFRQIFRLLQRL